MGKTNIILITEPNKTYYSNLLTVFPKDVNLVDDEEKADIYVFVNDYSVTPFLYGERKQHDSLKGNFLQNMTDIYYYNKALSRGIPMIGFEAGAHLINVMNGGTTFQHVYGHEAEHTAFTSEGYVFTIPSDHRQMMNPYAAPSYNYKVLAASYNYAGSYYNGENEDIELPDGFDEPEVVFYPLSNGLAIQSNPSATSKIFKESRQYFKKLIEDFIEDNMEEYECITNNKTEPI